MGHRVTEPTLTFGKAVVLWTVWLCLVSLAGLSANAQGGWDTMKGLVPRSYDCLHTPDAMVIDGSLSDAGWHRAPWSEPFVDIRGPGHPAPRYATRMKMMWDDEFLYVGAEMEEPHVWGTLEEKNSVIYYDNDFEVFVDPDGDRQDYYEFEMNVLNTIWELTLERTYLDEGPAHLGTNIEGLKSAVHVDGTVNDPSDEDAAWSVEIAIPWEGLARYSPDPVPPRAGDVWRINFSRVEWEHEIAGDKYRKVPEVPEDNWVWSPQGVIDMHRPERWGYVRFVRESAKSAWADPTLQARDFLMGIYYLQRRYREETGRWADDLSRLGPDAKQPDNADFHIAEMNVNENGYRLTVLTELPGGSATALSVDDSGRLWLSDSVETMTPAE